MGSNNDGVWNNQAALPVSMFSK